MASKDKGTEVVGFGETSMESWSFQDFMDHGVIQIDQIDDVVQVDQSELVGVPFILYSWDTKDSETYGGQYTVCRVKVATGTRVFADGGAGITEQLERYKQTLLDKNEGAFAPIFFPHGLRASSYVKNMPDGTKIPATTYYFDNSVD